MLRSSDRGQVDPLVALVAVAALGLGLSLYAGTVNQAIDTDRGADAERVLETVHDRVAPDGVARPSRLDDAMGRPGLRVNVTLTTRSHRWTAGPTPPTSADSADRRVSVPLDPGRVRPGRLRVSVW